MAGFQGTVDQTLIECRALLPWGLRNHHKNSNEKFKNQ